MEFFKKYSWKLIISFVILLGIIALFLFLKEQKKDIEETLPFPVIQTEVNKDDISLKDGLWKPINPFSIQNGKTVRIYNRPKWVRPDGKNWMAIEDVISVEKNNNKWTVHIGDSWVSLKVREESEDAGKFLSSIKYSINDGKRFGPILNASLAPNELEWVVEASSGATRKENGDIILKEYDGVELGLFFDDWRAMFKDKLEIKKGAMNNFKNELVNIRMDLTEVKKIAMAGNNEINLDPTIIYFHTDDSGYISSYDEFSWSGARGGNNLNTIRTNSNVASVYGFSDSGYYVYRGFLRFDVRDYSSIISAKLKGSYGYPIEIGSYGSIVWLKVPDYYSLDTDDWGSFYSGSIIEQKNISGVIDPEPFEINVTNYINPGEWNCFMTMNYEKDYNSNEPSSEEYSLTSYDVYLELEVPQPAHITLSPASNITTTSARLNGAITDVGTENPTVTIFWGSNDAGQVEENWDFSSAPTSPSQPQGEVPFYLDISDLDPNTTYWFSAKAVNSAGTAWPDSSLSFTTLLCQTDDDCEFGYSCVDNTCIIDNEDNGNPINGTCGTANKVYAYNETSFGQDTFCSTGTTSPENPVFPSAGNSVSWVCLGLNGGSNSNTCTATVSIKPISGQTIEITSTNKSLVILRSPGATNTVNTIVQTVKLFVQEIAYMPKEMSNQKVFVQVFQDLLARLKDLLTLVE